MSPRSWRCSVGYAVDANPLGVGLFVSPDKAITCAHVIDDVDDEIWLTKDGHPAVPLCVKKTAVHKEWFYPGSELDFAVIDIPSGFVTSTAPLGSLERPRIDTPIEATGFPVTAPRTGVTVYGTLIGTDQGGAWLQIDPVPGAPAWITQGFSGGPAVDRSTGLVVGIVVWAGRATNEAFVLPWDTIATSWPLISAQLIAPFEADPSYVKAQNCLSTEKYGEAASQLVALSHRYEEPRIFFLAALSFLGGRSPHEISGSDIQHVMKQLDSALRIDETYASAAALLGLVKEDFFRMRGLPTPAPSIESLTWALAQISQADAALIIQHLPDINSGTWRLLRHRSQDQ